MGIKCNKACEMLLVVKEGLHSVSCFEKRPEFLQKLFFIISTQADIIHE